MQGTAWIFLIGNNKWLCDHYLKGPLSQHQHLKVQDDVDGHETWEKSKMNRTVSMNTPLGLIQPSLWLHESRSHGTKGGSQSIILDGAWWMCYLAWYHPWAVNLHRPRWLSWKTEGSTNRQQDIFWQQSPTGKSCEWSFCTLLIASGVLLRDRPCPLIEMTVEGLGNNVF